MGFENFAVSEINKEDTNDNIDPSDIDSRMMDGETADGQESLDMPNSDDSVDSRITEDYDEHGTPDVSDLSSDNEVCDQSIDSRIPDVESDINLTSEIDSRDATEDADLTDTNEAQEGEKANEASGIEANEVPEFSDGKEKISVPDHGKDIQLQEKQLDKFDKRDLNTLDSNQRGALGEMKMDQYLRKLGFQRVNIDMATGKEDHLGKGQIDGVYFNKDGHPPIVIAEAKFNSSELKRTEDGIQMCDKWVDNRLDTSVGKENADKIRMEQLLNPNNVEKWLVKTDLNGNLTVCKLDQNASVISKERING